MGLFIYFPYATTDSFPLILLGCGRLRIEWDCPLLGGLIEAKRVHMNYLELI